MGVPDAVFEGDMLSINGSHSRPTSTESSKEIRNIATGYRSLNCIRAKRMSLSKTSFNLVNPNTPSNPGYIQQIRQVKDDRNLL